MKVIADGLICNNCALANNLLWTDDYQAEGDPGVCDTCGKRVMVIPTSDYIIPGNVTISKTGDIMKVAQELELTKTLLEKQSELYQVAVSEVEKLESELRLIKLGSKWGGAS